MPQNDTRIEQLLNRLDRLQKKQDQFKEEIDGIRRELQQLQSRQIDTEPSEFIPSENVTEDVASIPAPEKKTTKSSRFREWIKTDLEKFIGENLINKIGILITIIGVAIGARYVIDNDLITPGMRIISGYMVGVMLFGFALKLKNSIPKYSAVLFSGAMAIFYIITFAAFSLYNLFSPTPAFLLMVLITIFTVGAALIYNYQAVAHIGLVGAYAVPFLVGGGGTATPLFIYMVIINTGILTAGLYKYWKQLTLSAFVFTWIIFGSWFAIDFTSTDHFIPALLFSFIFFLIFYLSALSYKLIREQTFTRTDIWLILANAFIFYGFGYAILTGNENSGTWVGVFTACNAAIHAIAAMLIYRMGLADKNLFYLVTGLAVTFLTIAVPVELEGNWITLLWSAEALLLFWIGRTEQVAFYERMSHPVLALAFLSLYFDWNNVYPLNQMEMAASEFTILFNIHFFTSLFFVTCIAIIGWKDLQTASGADIYKSRQKSRWIRQLIWLTLILAIYFAFRLELHGWFNQEYIASKASMGNPFAAGNSDILRFRTLWNFNYTMLFISVLILASNRWFRHRKTVSLLFTTVVVCVLFFLGSGFKELGLLKDQFLSQPDQTIYDAGVFNIGIRYVCFSFLGLMLFTCHRLITVQNAGDRLKIAFDALLYITILWIISNELILWLDMVTAAQPYKLGLTILWGVYAVGIIIVGIKTNQKHLRIGAIALLGITLFKLFFFDITQLDALSRTVLFVTLGLLLLLASFLYNKFKKDMG